MAAFASEIGASPAGPLAGLDVVELGDGTAAAYAAKLLADYGADTVKVETGDGDSTRRRGPFPEGRSDPERSGLFLYLNTNKYGLALDLGETAGRRALSDVLARADVLVTDLPAARLRAGDLWPADLRARHPRLIVTTITPFGLDGPYARWRGDELVSYAMGGIAYSTPGMPDAAGDLEREPPLRPACFAAETIAGVVAASGTLMAAFARERSGLGCHVDVSQQAAVAVMQQRDVTTASYSDLAYDRLLNPTTIGRMPNFYLPCRDGYVAVAAPLDHQWNRLVEAMGSPAWAASTEFADGAARSANWRALRQRVSDWTLTLDSDQLFAVAEKQRLPIFPFYPLRKLTDCAHVRERGSLIGLKVGGRRARMPGAPVAMSLTPWRLRRPAPRLGEHTEAILRECRGAGAAPASPPAGAAPGVVARPLPLEGVRVLDLGQFIVMPFCTQWLAWMGAEVIVVESRRHFTSRTAPPFAPGHEGDPDASGYFNLLYGAKKSCTVDMTTDAGRDVVRRLAGAVDVMVDNFSTGVLEKLGLGYDVIRAINPAILMVSCGAFGRTGPLSHAMGFHSAANLFSGVADVTGYPGSHPRILGGVLPDPLGGSYAVFAILAALHHRRRTGQGQFVDLAMYETLLALIPEAVIDLTLNGVEPVRIGNRDRVKAPHGIYRCRAADTWVAISVSGDEDWPAFCRVVGRYDWLADPRFADAAARRAHVEALDAAVEAWTRKLTPAEATERLQAAGVAAGPILRSDELLDDRQLQARGLVVASDHPKGGRRRQLGVPWRMDTVAVEYRRAPLLGEHTHEILTKLLGMSEEEYARLHADGVLS